MEEKRPISDKAILEAFGETGDFVARDVDAAGFRLRAYFIDGLTSGGDISDFVIKPLSTVLSGQTPSELLEKEMCIRDRQSPGQAAQSRRYPPR